MKLLAPSILSADFLNLGSDILSIESAGADWIHCDIMDGQFVPNITFGPMVVSAVSKITQLPLDVHLMIKNPDALIPEFINAGANSITIHQEEVVHLHRSVDRIKSLGAKAGVAINPATSLTVLSEIYEYIDLLLIMMVNPGFGGQKFIASTLKKVVEVARLKKEKDFKFVIEVDGGVDINNISRIAAAGCDVFVAGSAVFSGGESYNNCINLKKLLKQEII